MSRPIADLQLRRARTPSMIAGSTGSRAVDEVEIVDYDPRWPAMYAAEANCLRAALPPRIVLAMEHFGSTAVPGLAAKPIIDILIAVPDITEARRLLVGPMTGLGYAFWADNPRQDRLFFVKGLPPAAAHRTHHVHMAEPNSQMWQRLPFRDYLRAHPEDRARYATLKRDLAARHRQDREAYTAAKSAFVNMILERARQEA